MDFPVFVKLNVIQNTFTVVSINDRKVLLSLSIHWAIWACSSAQYSMVFRQAQIVCTEEPHEAENKQREGVR